MIDVSAAAPCLGGYGEIFDLQDGGSLGFIAAWCAKRFPGSPWAFWRSEKGDPGAPRPVWRREKGIPGRPSAFRRLERRLKQSGITQIQRRRRLHLSRLL